MASQGETTFVQDYDVYHDESKIAGYWHGILFVPRATRHRLLTLLEDARTFAKHRAPISLKKLDDPGGPIWRIINSWLHVGIAALIQDLKGQRYPIFTGQYKRTPGYGLLENVIGARFILFRVRDGLGSLNAYPDDAAKVETTFRMALRYGLAIFSGQGDQLCIRSLHFDGHQHYGRSVDRERILGRLGVPPTGIVLHENLSLDDRSSDHRLSTAQQYEDCQLLQLTDIFVGGFRTVLGEATNAIQRSMCSPLLELSRRWDKGPARMRNSKWSRGFCIREGFIQDGGWRFDAIQCPADKEQSNLFARE